MNYQLLQGKCLDTLRTLEAETVQTCITSPPYFRLRDYQTATWEGGEPDCEHTISDYSDRLSPNVKRPFRGNRQACLKCGALRIDEQIGLEETLDEYVCKLVEVFREVKRVLRPDGTLWLNLGASYNGSGGAGGHYGPGGIKEGQPKYPGCNLANYKAKDMIPVPWIVAMALQQDGFYLRSDIIWSKSNPLPESVTDRPTRSHEYIFLLSKSEQYYYDAAAIAEPSVTNDNRRPYGSKGAWLLDGRPEEQRHGGEQRSPRDSFKRAGSKREQPIPGQSVGTHRPDREESDYDTNTRNKRSVWTVATNTHGKDHYATYPPALVEPCVLAGTSAYGSCAACGAPWRRVVEKDAQLEQGRKTPGYGTSTDAGGFTTNGHGKSTLHHTATSTTTGWQPTCACNASVVPCTVLDPFSGTATTGAVALKHGRAYIGCELSAQYLEIARRRLRRVQPLLFALA